eukprot:scaffold10442_cov106-Isochrysis_galbana.AAC.1
MARPHLCTPFLACSCSPVVAGHPGLRMYIASPRGKWDDSGTRALRGDLGTCEKFRWPPAPPSSVCARRTMAAFAVGDR